MPSQMPLIRCLLLSLAFCNSATTATDEGDVWRKPQRSHLAERPARWQRPRSRRSGRARDVFVRCWWRWHPLSGRARRDTAPLRAPRRSRPSARSSCRASPSGLRGTPRGSRTGARGSLTRCSARIHISLPRRPRPPRARRSRRQRRRSRSPFPEVRGADGRSFLYEGRLRSKVSVLFRATPWTRAVLGQPCL
jgi:hypothetical protein